MAGKFGMRPSARSRYTRNIVLQQNVMQQPELGRRLIALRKEKNLTQEELVEKSHVSVRTIQRIEAGEVLPRVSTIKILLEALGESFETFSSQQTQVMDPQKRKLPSANRTTLLIAMLAGAVYLVLAVIAGALDIAWFTRSSHWGFTMNAVYTVTTVLMVLSYVLFARGFIALATLFENSLLKIASYLVVVTVVGMAALNITSLSVDEVESMWFPYSVSLLLTGAISIIFGVSLIRLQDSMGELSRVAGILEIVMGCMLITIILFFITYVIMIPAMVVEILVLYRGYEYLSRPESAQPTT